MNNKDELYHYGVKGMKWKGHVYATRDELKTAKRRFKQEREASKQSKDDNNQTPSKKKMSTKKKVAIGAAAVVGTLAAGYAARKLSYFIRGKAGEKAVETGQKFYDAYMGAARISFDGGNQAGYEKYRYSAKETMRNAGRLQSKLHKSTLSAIKYLRHPERYNVDYTAVGSKWR